MHKHSTIYLFAAITVSVLAIAIFYMGTSRTAGPQGMLSPHPAAATTGAVDGNGSAYRIPSPKRRVGATWSNDFLAFNAAGDRLAVYFIGGDTQLFDLNTKERIWWSPNAVTCWRASVQFDEKKQVLVVYDYVNGDPWIDHCLSFSSGKDLVWKIYPDGDASEKDPEFKLLRLQQDATKQDGNALLEPPFKFSLDSSKNGVLTLRGASPDGKETAYVSPDIGTPEQPICHIFKASGGSYDFNIGQPAIAVRYSPDGQRLAILHESGIVSIWQRDSEPDSWKKEFSLPSEVNN
jgi:WD40 repeat protein